MDGAGDGFVGAARRGVVVERSEAPGERGVLLTVQVLVPEEEHLVAEQDRAELVTDLVGQGVAEVEAIDLGADRGLEGADVEATSSGRLRAGQRSCRSTLVKMTKVINIPNGKPSTRIMDTDPRSGPTRSEPLEREQGGHEPRGGDHLRRQHLHPGRIQAGGGAADSDRGPGPALGVEHRGGQPADAHVALLEVRGEALLPDRPQFALQRGPSGDRGIRVAGQRTERAPPSPSRRDR